MGTMWVMESAGEVERVIECVRVREGGVGGREGREVTASHRLHPNKEL